MSSDASNTSVDSNTPTPHNEARKGDFADVVLMPGDPLRSQFIAREFLDNAKLVNNVRGVQGYTGTYKGKEISVMASGMGQPSIGIYSYELYKFYDVNTIIRVGSCGCFTPNLYFNDIIICSGACTDGGFVTQFNLDGQFAPISDPSLNNLAMDYCQKNNINFEVGNILSSDRFYEPFTSSLMDWAKLGVLGVEMESAALYCNAAFLAKRALTICSVSDHFLHPEKKLTAEERQHAFTNMIEVGLEVGIQAKDLPERKPYSEAKNFGGAHK